MDGQLRQTLGKTTATILRNVESRTIHREPSLEPVQWQSCELPFAAFFPASFSPVLLSYLETLNNLSVPVQSPSHLCNGPLASLVTTDVSKHDNLLLDSSPDSINRNDGKSIALNFNVPLQRLHCHPASRTTVNMVTGSRLRLESRER